MLLEDSRYIVRRVMRSLKYFVVINFVLEDDNNVFHD